MQYIKNQIYKHFIKFLLSPWHCQFVLLHYLCIPGAELSKIRHQASYSQLYETPSMLFALFKHTPHHRHIASIFACSSQNQPFQQHRTWLTFFMKFMGLIFPYPITTIGKSICTCILKRKNLHITHTKSQILSFHK